MKKVLFIIISILAIWFAFFSCQKMFDNPYDANSNKDAWAPDSVDYFVIFANKCELIWELDEDRIDGFKIDKCIDNNWITEYTTISKELRSWIDKNYVYNADNPVKYRIYAYAGQNLSTFKEVIVTPILPQLVIDSVYNIADTGLTMTTRITQNGKSRISKSGVCWSEISNPDTSDNYIINTYTIPDKVPYSYQQHLNELEPAKHYYIKAFIENAVGISYSDQIEIITHNMQPTIPTVKTLEAIDISTHSIRIAGEVISQGSQPVIKRGVCYSTNANPDISSNHTENGAGLGEFTAEITGLTPNTNYYICAYARNYVGIAYGDIINIKTSEIQLPTLTTTSITEITSMSAKSGGVIQSAGGGQITSRGVCWNTTPNPTTSNYHTVDGTGTGAFISDLNNLIPGTTYYVRAYATNEYGTAYGQERTFRTLIDNGSGSDCSTSIYLPFSNYSSCGEMAFTNVDFTIATTSFTNPVPSCGDYISGNTKDLWYRFIVPTGVNSLALHAFNSPPPILDQGPPACAPGMAVYRGTCGNLTLIDCFNADAGFMGMSNGEIRWKIINVTPGETIFVRLWEKTNNETSIFFVASIITSFPEADCNNPPELSTSGCNILAPSGATIQAPEECDWNATDNVVFYYFTVDASDIQPVNITISNIDCINNDTSEEAKLQIAIYKWNGFNCLGIGGSDSTYMGCANGTGTIFYSKYLSPGKYILAIDGYSSTAGNSLCTFDIQINN